MSKLEDDFILACAKVEGEFYYEADTNTACYVGDFDRDEKDEIIQVKLKGDSVLINTTGIFEVRNIKSINFNDAEKTIVFKNNNAIVYTGRHNYIGGRIE